MAYWGNDPYWQSLPGTSRAAAMAIMEADGRNPGDAKNALGAMLNRAHRDGGDIGAHVSKKIYQPTIEPSQFKRLPSIIGSPLHADLMQQAEGRVSGQTPDWVNGATHFLAHPNTMLGLEAREPNKYRSWRNWTGYSDDTGQYANQVMADNSHAFLAPEGRYSAKYDGSTPQGGSVPPRRMTLTDAMASGYVDPSQMPMNAAAVAAAGAMPQAGVPVPTEGAAPTQDSTASPPNKRFSKLADMLLASAAEAKPTGWGSMLNALGDATLGYGLANKEDNAQKAYSKQLSQTLQGAGTPNDMARVLIGSGDPEMMKMGIGLKSKDKTEDMTNSMKEYRFAMGQRRAAGEPPISFLDYDKGLKAASASKVNVENKQEGEYEKTRGGALGKEYGKIMEEAAVGGNNISQVDTIDKLLSDPSVYTGTGGNAIAGLKKFGKTLLGLDFEGVGNAEAAQRITTRLALDAKSDLPGPMSNSDRDFLMSIPPNIGDSAEGRSFLMSLIKRREQRKIDIGNLARQYRAKNGRLDDGWYDTLAEFGASNPFVTENDFSFIKTKATATPQPSPAAGVPLDLKKKFPFLYE